MRVNLVTMPIADYCGAFERNEISINKNYQRNPQVWPIAPRSYLIETILLNFPVPKLALHQVTDLATKKTHKHVVDGQQRTIAIRDFYSNKLRLSARLETVDAAGRTYAELPQELQEAFLSYQLTFDQFEAASEEEVREYFRRINSFTAPLNAEEQRHARYQGPMKWLINELAARYGERFASLGILSEKQVIRMGDAKLLSEIIHALLYGVETTSKSKLDSLYQANDKGGQAPREAEIRTALQTSFNRILDMRELRGTSILTKTHVFYSLWLAMIGLETSWPELSTLLPRGRVLSSRAELNLLTLAAALDEAESGRYDDYSKFIAASSSRTNVADQRKARISWLARALVGEEFPDETGA